MRDVVGTPLYAAPEVLQGKYGQKCDLWSIGVVTYMLLSGQPPFNGKDVTELDDKIKRCDFDYVGEVWKTEISKQARKFIECLLEPDASKRLNCEQALNHSWITSSNLDTDLNHIEQVKAQIGSASEIFLRLADFKQTKRLQVELLLLFVKLLD